MQLPQGTLVLDPPVQSSETPSPAGSPQQPSSPPPDPRHKGITPDRLKRWLRPMVLISVGLHAVIFFTPLTSRQKPQPKEKEPPVKLSRLSDKVLVKNLPKVKLTDAAKLKTALPKVNVASTNPVVVKPSPQPEPKPSPSASPEAKPSPQPSQPPAPPSNQGADPATVDPKQATTDANQASKLDVESQKFGGVIASLASKLNPSEGDTLEPDPNDLEEPTAFFPNPDDPTTAHGGIQGKSWVANVAVDDVAASLASEFPDGFTPKGEYGGGQLFEAKVGQTVRYISVVPPKIGLGAMVFLWQTSPI